MTHRPHTPSRRHLLGALAGAGAACALPCPAQPMAGPPERQPRPWRVPAVLPDALAPAPLAGVHIEGWLGHRIDINNRVRLEGVDLAPMLAGFRQRPGSHPWIGEHIGKWLHAATLAWAHGGSTALRAKLDGAVAELIATQEPDGYLGTYAPGHRLTLEPGADWDVWSHKYALIGLITYHRHTGDAAAVQAAARAADLLLATFPAQRSLIDAGTHDGLAATSVLEPMVLLYRCTADARYLAFAQHIVALCGGPRGPGVLRRLLATGGRSGVEGGKAYELLSNLLGLVELARVTGDRALLDSAQGAWQDVAERRLYPTGTASQWEHFQPAGHWQDDVRAHLGETCVTTTWIQLSLALLLHGGQARHADAIERALYNHLTAAQHPAGDDWCYFTPLHGRKPYHSEITCCHSSGPRGLALAPLTAYLSGHDGDADVLHVNTLESSAATLLLGGQAVTVQQASGFPLKGHSRLQLRMAAPARFALRVRVPAWAPALQLQGAAAREGWLELPARTWRDGDALPLRWPMAGRLLAGHGVQDGRAALGWGPFMLACEEPSPGPHPGTLQRLRIAGAPRAPRWSPGAPLRLQVPLASDGTVARGVDMSTFADAGAQGQRIRMWLRAPGAHGPAAADSLLWDGVPSQSRGVPGPLLLDDDHERFATTRAAPADREAMPALDWFAVTLPKAVHASRFVFTPGVAAPDGGWFDTREGPPQLQVQRRAGGAWHTVGVFSDHPATTATDAGGLDNSWDRRALELRLPQPLRFVALRVVGRPAGLPAPYASCAELQAFSA